MYAVKQALWLVMALISFSGFAWYFVSATPPHPLSEDILSTTADTVIQNLTVREFDHQGQLAHYVETPLMRHIEKNNTHWLKTPRIIIKQANQKDWTIQAQQAVTLHGGEQITFSRQVIVHQVSGVNNQESTFATEELVYFPKTKLATSPVAVSYQQPGNMIQSTGMRAYLDKKHVQLLNEARGTYEGQRG